ncbi:AAA family ATPase [Naasia sp. SYSU D00948]|uniref:AAA family ATPase n=1 Tax=Naasia sp. SYSU D00948 TaxID=2817379 RepID=UPI001B302E8D|nr:AAA family ATPase [Naasia sp. SYSU D00948]
MKILRLRLAGFGPYKDEQVVDFEQFDADGIFLISGKTGAGKSSILDAICFALYNAIPRYDGRDAQIRSHHCGPDDPSFVELEFRLRGEEYRIYRTPEYQRPAKRGGGLTTAKPEARLDIRDGDGWRGLAAMPREVGIAIAEILPIEKDQFLQVILLAQNRFQKFLLAKTDERRAVLRTLFGTLRFEMLEADLIERRKLLEQEVDGSQQLLRASAAMVAEQADLEAPAGEPTLDWFLQAGERVTEQLVVASASADTARAAADEAEERWRSVEALRARQDRRANAEAKLAVLAEQEAEVADLRTALELAERAARVLPQIEAREAAAATLATATEREAEATREWTAVAPPEDADDPGHAAERLTAALGALESALADEARLPRLDADVVELAQLLGVKDELIRDRESRIADLPRQLEEHDGRIAAAAQLAATIADRRRELERLASAVDAARTAERLETELAVAQDAERAASGGNRSAAAEYDELLNRRHADIASELAASLTAGAACLVCGATEHPAPAPLVEDPVTPEAIEQAKNAMGDRQRELDAASRRVGEVAAALAAARATAGGALGDLVAEREAVATLLTATEAAQAERAMLEVERSRMRERLDTEQQALADDRARRQELATRHTEAEVRAFETRSRVASQVGEYGSVAERARRLRVQRDAAAALVAARRTVAQRAETLAEAEAALIRQLGEQRFEDASTALAARLSVREIADARARVKRWDDESAACRGVLSEPDLNELPGEPVDLEPYRSALLAARAIRDEAIATEAALRDRAAQVRSRVGEVEDLFARSARLLDEYAQVRELAAVVKGDEPNTKRMRLETFVLAAQLEEIIAAANRRLRTMTDGRYTLVLDDSRQYRNAEAGLGLSVLDEHTGVPRQTASLSGGEMFLASLALALGLAEVVSQQAGGIRLDTLFVDEGFGSLDGETLEVAMHALDGLRAGGRTIGLISHVEAMKEQISAKLAITVRSTGESEIESSYAMV